MKKLTNGKVWCFAVGQFGWSVLAALISTWLVPFYQPDPAALKAGQPIFIPQGRVILGVLTVLGAITAFGRVFDAVTDPLIASFSDRCKSKAGRRIPFMRAAAIPFALVCVLAFCSPRAGDIIPFASGAQTAVVEETADETAEAADEAAQEVADTAEAADEAAQEAADAAEAGEAADEVLLTEEQQTQIARSGNWPNALFLFAMLTLFYLFMTMYCTPYNALIPELGADQKTRMNISTAISFTYIAGMAVAYLAPMIWGALEASMPRANAMRITFACIAALGTVCMFVPVFTIREQDYVNVVPSESTAMRSLAATFRNHDFRVFVASDVAYFLGLTMFQTALPFFVRTLLGLEESMYTVYFVLMTALSMLFYIPVNKLTPKFGKKKLILCAFVIFTLAFTFTAFFGKYLPFSPTAQGYILCAIAAPAMAIFGILPQAVVADIAESDALDTHEERAGMFYAARTFAFKLGQSIAMLLVTAFGTIGLETGLGYRITAVAAAVVCALGGLLFLVYDEKKIYAKILHKGPEA